MFDLYFILKILVTLILVAILAWFSARWRIRYGVSREEAEVYYKNGNGIFNKMSYDEKEDFKNKDNSLPLGL